MSAEVLRRAASLMRERAEAATRSPWRAIEGSSGGWWVELPSLADVAIDLHGENAEHIASWHPAVALAVADWLDGVAEVAERNTKRMVAFYGAEHGPRFVADTDPAALTVARAYLGESA